METFGRKLTEARLARGLELDQVSRETNISRRYLEALEHEDFAVFPGEPYLLGFLRNYSDYLGLPSNEIVSVYKNLKIQESPVPLKDLMPSRPIVEQIFGRRSGTKILTGLVITGASILVILFIIFIAGKIASAKPVEKAVEVREKVTHQVPVEGFKGRVYEGDTLVVTSPAGTWNLVVQTTAPSLKIETPTGIRMIELGQDLLVDLSGDTQPDIKLFVADLFRTDPSKGAEIHISSGTATDGEQTDATATTPQDVVVAAAGTTAPASGDKYQVLFEGGSAYPVTLNATFRGYCLFRFESDRTNREERYYQKSELLTVQANNGIRIWASNGNAVKLQIIAGGKTVDLEPSRAGEVIVRDLKWLKDDQTGRFKFVVMDID
jgi:cytoskeleton protein RodZ